ncbi:MAG: hypothetical protein PV353_00595, partial [Bartonella sp.]|nr:hypothetical protein [Bartonella sp.]
KIPVAKMSSSKGYKRNKKRENLTCFDTYIGNKVKILALEDFLYISLFWQIFILRFFMKVS